LKTTNFVVAVSFRFVEYHLNYITLDRVPFLGYATAILHLRLTGEIETTFYRVFHLLVPFSSLPKVLT